MGPIIKNLFRKVKRKIKGRAGAVGVITLAGRKENNNPREIDPATGARQCSHMEPCLSLFLLYPKGAEHAKKAALKT